MNSFRIGKYRIDYIGPRSTRARAGWVWCQVSSWANRYSWWASIHLFPKKEFRVWGHRVDDPPDMMVIHDFGLGPLALISWAP